MRRVVRDGRGGAVARFPIPMRGSEQEEAESLGIDTSFPIPMRGSERAEEDGGGRGGKGFPIPMRGSEWIQSVSHVVMKSCREFPIPMRGSERCSMEPAPKRSAAFPIPMRGSEILAVGTTGIGGIVSDPHEG